MEKVKAAALGMEEIILLQWLESSVQWTWMRWWRCRQCRSLLPLFEPLQASRSSCPATIHLHTENIKLNNWIWKLERNAWGASLWVWTLTSYRSSCPGIIHLHTEQHFTFITNIAHFAVFVFLLGPCHRRQSWKWSWNGVSRREQQRDQSQILRIWRRKDDSTKKMKVRRKKRKKKGW